MKISNKQIAAELLERAKDFPEWCNDHEPLAVFHFGTLKLRCKPTSNAVEAMATKFGKGTKFKNPKPVRVKMARREPTQQIINRYKVYDCDLAQQFRDHFDIQLGIL